MRQIVQHLFFTSNFGRKVDKNMKIKNKNKNKKVKLETFTSEYLQESYFISDDRNQSEYKYM